MTVVPAERTPRVHHLSGIETWTRTASALTTTSRRLSRGRLSVAVTVAVLVVLTAGYGRLAPGIGWGLVALGVLTFVGLVWWHDRVEASRRRADARVRLGHEGLARMARDWSGLPDGGTSDVHLHSEVPRGTPSAASDLDLFGRASLRQLLGRTATPHGDTRLLAWLDTACRGESFDLLAARQAAVRELAGMPELREALLAEALSSAAFRSAAPATLFAWADGRGTLLASRWLAALVGVVPLASLALLLADRGGARVAGGWLAVVGLAWGLRVAFGRQVRRAFAGSDAISGEVRRYGVMLERWESARFESAQLNALQAKLRDGEWSASQALASLGRRVDLADLRWSHLPHVFVHSLTAWDLHVACSLERWNARHGAHLRGWFDALADLDALATLAGLAHDEPTWNYPRLDGTADTLEAAALGHPLLAADTRVHNDVAVGPPGTVLVVTGSNMSGKSTLLRGLGLNVVLAQLGTPVCARSLTLPPLRLETSIRIADSLADGVSYFMAALLRLKEVVEAADRPRRPGQPRVFYLLDEVLQGTNSEERQVAIRHIVEHLARSAAIGALTTHDLHLVHAPEFRRHARHVHFTEHLEERDGVPVMRFDYQLREGPARSRNALALVRMVGLGAGLSVTATPSTDYDARTKDQSS